MFFKLNSIMQYRFIVTGIIYFLILFITSCSNSIFKNKADQKGELTQRAIFQYLSQPSRFMDELTGKGLTKIDPLVCVRDTVVFNRGACFAEPMHSDELKYPLSKKSYQLTIPDSLANKFRYTGPGKDYGLDYAIIHQFSPLLPTVEPKVFLIEHYLYANKCEDYDSCVRVGIRDYLKVRIEKDKIVFLEGIAIDWDDFCGFGGFSKRELEDGK